MNPSSNLVEKPLGILRDEKYEKIRSQLTNPTNDFDVFDNESDFKRLFKLGMPYLEEMKKNCATELEKLREIDQNTQTSVRGKIIGTVNRFFNSKNNIKMTKPEREKKIFELKNKESKLYHMIDDLNNLNKVYSIPIKVTSPVSNRPVSNRPVSNRGFTLETPSNGVGFGIANDDINDEGDPNNTNVNVSEIENPEKSNVGSLTGGKRKSRRKSRSSRRKSRKQRKCKNRRK